METAHRAELRAKLRARMRPTADTGSLQHMARQFKNDPQGMLLRLGIDDAEVLRAAPTLLAQPHQTLSSLTAQAAGPSAASALRADATDNAPDDDEESADSLLAQPLTAVAPVERAPETAACESDGTDTDDELPPTVDDEPSPSSACPVAPAGSSMRAAIDEAYQSHAQGRALTTVSIEQVCRLTELPLSSLTYIGPAATRWAPLVACTVETANDLRAISSLLAHAANLPTPAISLPAAAIAVICDDRALDKQAKDMIERSIPAATRYWVSFRFQPKGFRLQRRVGVQTVDAETAEMKVCVREPPRMKKGRRT